MGEQQSDAGNSFVFRQNEMREKNQSRAHFFLCVCDCAEIETRAAVVISVASNVYFQFRQTLCLVNLTVLLAERNQFTYQCERYRDGIKLYIRVLIQLHIYI